MLNLFAQIETGLKTEFEGKQLACISKLVFYCGIQAKEIPELRIRDVIGKDGEIIRKIKIKGGRDINLNSAAAEAVRKYVADLRQKRPSLMQGHERLFPGYPNVDKLKRDWKRFGTDCRSIKEAGYLHYRDCERQKGTRAPLIYKKGAEQLRVTTRQFRAVATGNKIRRGKTIDESCIEEMRSLDEQAIQLDNNTDDAVNKALAILDKFEKTVNSMRCIHLRDSYGKAYHSSIERSLAPILEKKPA